MARTITMITDYSTLRLTGGCAAIPAGAGGGDDLCTRVKEELIRAYANDFDPTENAAIQSLEYLNVTVKAPQGNRAPVTMTIRAIRNDMTEVAVQCGYEGCWDRNTAERIHVTIPDTI